MKLNSDKSKYMIVNFTNDYQFSTRLMLEGKPLDQISEAQLLGVKINDKLTWDSNTDHIVKKAYKKMMILHNLYPFNLPIHEMVNIYILYIRSGLEYSAVVWHSSLTVANQEAIERVQKVALRIILKDQYVDYSNALSLTGLTILGEQDTLLCTKFARKCKFCGITKINDA